MELLDGGVPDNEPKLCTDCAHHVDMLGQPQCRRRERRSLVDGSAILDNCNNERYSQENDACGLKAKYFKKRKKK